MIELINVPDRIMNKKLWDEDVRTAGMNKFDKIQEIRKLYSDVKIEDELAEYLYSGRGPIEIFLFKPRPRAKLSEKILKEKVVRTFEINSFDDLIVIGEEQGNNADDQYFEVKVRKIMKMKSRKEQKYVKYLIQLTFLGRYSIHIDPNGNLVQLRKTKVVNCVLDHHRGILQVRTDCSSTQSCMSFFEKLFSNYDFFRLNFDLKLIDQIKSEEYLSGSTYECMLASKRTDHVGIGRKPWILKETYKIENYPKGKPIHENQHINEHLEKYDIVSDVFYFYYEFPEHESRKYGLQLNAGVEPVHFRSSAPEIVIDRVLDIILEIVNQPQNKSKIVKIEKPLLENYKTA